MTMMMIYAECIVTADQKSQLVQYHNQSYCTCVSLHGTRVCGRIELWLELMQLVCCCRYLCDVWHQDSGDEKLSTICSVADADADASCVVIT